MPSPTRERSPSRPPISSHGPAKAPSEWRLWSSRPMQQRWPEPRGSAQPSRTGSGTTKSTRDGSNEAGSQRAGSDRTVTSRSPGVAARTILMVTPYFPPEGGGLERYAKIIGKLLMADFGWRVVFVTSGRRGTSVTVTEEDGLKVYRVPAQITLSRTPLSTTWPRLLRKIARDENAVLVNAHAPVPGLPDAASVMSGSLPFVLTYHAGPMHKGRPLLDPAIWLYEQTLLRHMAGVRARSSATLATSKTSSGATSPASRSSCRPVSTRRHSPPAALDGPDRSSLSQS